MNKVMGVTTGMFTARLRKLVNMTMQGLLDMPRLGFAWVLITIVLLIGCSTLAERDRYVKLQHSVERYASDIRWGRYDAAASFIARKENSTGTVDARRFEDIRVTGYDMATGELAKDNEKASISVTFTYYDTNSGRLQSLVDIQHWWYNEPVGQWFLDGALPHFSREASSAR
jgi:hypothetical protein